MSSPGGELSLRPLAVADAAAMSAVLADPELYWYIGGEPPAADALARRYASQVRGASPDGSQVWINLIIERGSEPVGYVQATIAEGEDAAEIAWVVGVPWQGRGYATAAARQLASHLWARGVRRLVAHIHPDHTASQRVATAVGLSATDDMLDGEVRWEGWTSGPTTPAGPGLSEVVRTEPGSAGSSRRRGPR